MTLIAGIDIGNSTTEIVVQERGVPVAWRRRPTRGMKGSVSSVRAAAALLRAIEREHRIRADRVVVAPWRPVTTELACIAEAVPDTGRIRVMDCASHSVCGDGAAVGVPWDLSDDPPQAEPAIAVVAPGTGYKQAVSRIREVSDQGYRVAGIVAARDEAVLIASRLELEVPVVDGVDSRAALQCTKLFVEVRSPGRCVTTASDVWALTARLGLDDSHADSLSLVARWVGDERAVVIGVLGETPRRAVELAANSVTWRSGETVDLFDAIDRLGARPVGAVRAYAVSEPRQTLDLWGTDITGAVAERGIRSPGRSRDVVLASLAGEIVIPQADLREHFGVPVEIATSEAMAASLGARTTPGLPERALILDIGGGTIDLVGTDGITAAGGGEMLTAAVSRVLEVPRGAADWIKRGPARRVESPQVLLNEDGSRHFVSEDEMAVSPRAVGMLATRGPGGHAYFGGGLQPSEWRIIRHALKLEVIAKNVGRVIRTCLDSAGSGGQRDVVIVGGPAGDDELLPAIGRLGNVKAYGRGNVAGCLGHRYAVAYGLTLQNPSG